MGLIARILREWTHRRVKLVKEPEWVTVYQSSDEYAVRIRVLLLEDNDIEVRLFDQRDSTYNAAFGYIYLNVRNQRAAEAMEILSGYE